MSNKIDYWTFTLWSFNICLILLGNKTTIITSKSSEAAWKISKIYLKEETKIKTGDKIILDGQVRYRIDVQWLKKESKKKD